MVVVGGGEIGVQAARLLHRRSLSVVLAVAIPPRLAVGGAELLEVQASGPRFDRLVARITDTVRRLWILYAGLTALEIVLLHGWHLAGWAPNMSLFDAVAHGLTTMPTGGFSPEARSITVTPCGTRGHGPYLGHGRSSAPLLRARTADRYFRLSRSTKTARAREPMRQEVLRPVDVAVALALARSPGQGYEPLSETLGISLNTAHQAVQRLISAGLVGEDRQIHGRALLGFLTYGVRHAFFAEPGPEVRGVPTAHAGPPLAEEIVAGDKYVWPSARGDVRGAAIPPLYDGTTELAARAPELYQALTLVDALRVGRARERQLAREKLEAWLEGPRHSS